MTEPTAEEFRERLAKARADADAAIMGLIWLELGELVTALSASEDQAAAALREAVEALAEPQAHIAAVDAEIASADAKCAELAAQVGDDTDDDNDPDPDDTALARLRLQEWERRSTRLRSKRDFAESGYQPLYEQRDQARKVLADLQMAKRGVMAAQLNPFGSPLAQATRAYVGYRQPFLNLVLLKNDRDSPEWEPAIAELEECCIRSAYRTDHLIGNAEQQARAMTAQMPDALAESPAPAPGMADVMKRTVLRIEDEVQNTRIAARDRRPPSRPEMQVPRLRDMGLG